MNRNPVQNHMGKLTRIAILIAILLIMGFTPLGYFNVNPLMKITFNMIPVVVGAILLGPSSGALLGGVFGLTSFFQPLTGADPLGALMLSQSLRSAIFLFILCLVPRILAGWLTGLVFKGLNHALGKKEIGKIAAVSITALAGSILNTVLFVAAFIGLFSTNELVTQAFGTTSIWVMITILVTTNAIAEAVVCTVVGGAIGRVLLRFLPIRTLKKTDSNLPG
jgi:uncharacterized membrane protein